MQRPTAIEVRNARTHNLKGVSCRVPHGRVTVVTGPSGAGKSSLAFDTVYAEGHRRFVESMSTYARNFLEQRERPPVDEIRNVLPAVALAARNGVRNARSTVGTLTEIHDVLRLLFAHLGEVVCPAGHGRARRSSPSEAAAELAAGEVGDPFRLVVRQPRPRRGADAALSELVRLGFGRYLDGEEVCRLEPGAPWPAGADPLPLLLGRFRAAPESAPRVAAALEEGLRMAPRVEAEGPSGRRFVAAELACPHCGEAVSPPSPALFSFNSPLGACPECQGFGRVMGIDRERVVPDPTRPLAARPIAPWNSPAYEDLYDELLAAAAARGIDPDTPWGSSPRPTGSGSGAGRGSSATSTTSSPGSRSAPTRSTCGCCSRATALMISARAAGVPGCAPRRWRSAFTASGCRICCGTTWRRSRAGSSASAGPRGSGRAPGISSPSSASASRCSSGWGSSTSSSTAKLAPSPAARRSGSTSRRRSAPA
ncbi:MAG: hypothetical protein M5U13_01715 [Thermoanaerobaculia bacterium]|nr:hypothetical protein [Thermoanaerobaculia bacterium]